MEKGMAIIEVNDTEVKGIHIEQEVVEFARLNAQTKKHIDEAKKKRTLTAAKKVRAEKEEARRKAYTANTVKYILFRCGIAGAVAALGAANLIAPIVYMPVVLFCLCTACVSFGVWYGRGHK